MDEVWIQYGYSMVVVPPKFHNIFIKSSRKEIKKSLQGMKHHITIATNRIPLFLAITN
jgi:hypothetical protein